jgi:cytochrome c biogenesis protein CcdA
VINLVLTFTIPGISIGGHLGGAVMGALCGFAMLPAYLSYFLGLDDDSDTSESAVLRAIGVSLVVTAGFVTVFTVIGVLINAAAAPIQENVPFATLVIGIALVALGIAMLAGFQPVLALPKLERGGNRRTLWSMFVFGVSYAVASLSCTLPLFLVAVTGVFSSESFTDGRAAFVAYGLGMGLVLTALTVALALARASLVRRFATVAATRLARASDPAGAAMLGAGLAVE